MIVKPNRSGPHAVCGIYCAEVGGVGECPGEDTALYKTRYECAGHPLAAGGSCGWSGVLAGTDNRDPSCPKCGGWVVKSGGARLRRVK